MTGPSVLVAMSGGVDSSVAAGLLLRDGYEVTGVTMKLWGGEQDSGCCSVSDVEDARRVADQLGIEHHVFNFGDEFEQRVVGPYVDAHRQGSTPNPCIACNRHLKFDKLLRRAAGLGFELVATGHHARIVDWGGLKAIARGADSSKDQSYVLHMLDQEQLARILLPLGELTKPEVRSMAADLGLRTADKPDSQDVCFIAHTSGGREHFLAERMDLTPGVAVDGEGTVLADIPAVELVTVGQRKGLGVAGSAEPTYANDVDMSTATVTIGPRRDLFVERTPVRDLVWLSPVDGPVSVQTSAHGDTAQGLVEDNAEAAARGGAIHWTEPRHKVAPGQSVVFYQDDRVVGSALADRG